MGEYPKPASPQVLVSTLYNLHGIATKTHVNLRVNHFLKKIALFVVSPLHLASVFSLLPLDL